MPLEESEGEANSSDEEAIPSAKKLKTVDREASYVIVASPGGIFRLRRAGSYGCWMGRKRDFRDAAEFDTKPAAIPTFASYVGHLRRTTTIASRARPCRPIRETARSLGTKLRGKGGLRLWVPRDWGRRAGSRPDRCGYGDAIRLKKREAMPGIGTAFPPYCLQFEVAGARRPSGQVGKCVRGAV